MKAAVFQAPHQPLTIEEVEIMKPKRREVLLRTAYAGLCHSDLHFMEGLYPYPAPAVLGQCRRSEERERKTRDQCSQAVAPLLV